MTIRVASNIVFDSNRNPILGDFAGRPKSVSAGTLFFNAQVMVGWNGSTWQALTANGQSNIWAWGQNQYGQIGNGLTTSTSSPVAITGGINNWSQVSSTASENTCAIRSNGVAWSWGRGGYGVLGNDLSGSTFPTPVLGSIDNWSRLSTNTGHTLGIRSDGTMWGWGRGSSGRLGNNSTAATASPVQVVGGLTWVTNFAGGFHSGGITNSGTAWCWGYNGSGQCGHNITTASTISPVLVAGGFTDWTKITGSRYGTAAIRANGTAWSWGNINGDGIGGNRSSPVSVAGNFSDWVEIFSGEQCHFAIRSNGEMWGWGSNNYGALGNNSTTATNSPVQVAGGFTDWIQASGGRDFSVGLRSNGTAWAWGHNSSGQLGIGNTTNVSSPVQIAGGFTDWIMITGGFRTAKGLRFVS